MATSEPVRMQPQHEAAYECFVEAHPDAMLYHSLPYLRMLKSLLHDEPQAFLCFDDAGQLEGVLPFFRHEGAHGPVYNSLPYYGSNGGVLAKSERTSAILLDAWNAMTSDAGAATLVSNPIAENDFREKIAHTLTDHRIGQFSDIAHLENHPEKLLESFHYKTRNMVRKSQKQGFAVSIENGNSDFLRRIHQENMQTIGGRPKSDDFFASFPVCFEPDSQYRIWIARHEGEPVAALLLFYFRDMVEYYTPVIKAEWRDRQPLSLLIYEAMCDASRRGYRLWNWGGTWATQDGVYLFKKRWGARERNYTYFIRVNNALLYEQSRETLLAEYPDYFVLPFNRLKESA